MFSPRLVMVKNFYKGVETNLYKENLRSSLKSLLTLYNSPNTLQGNKLIPVKLSRGVFRTQSNI